MQKHRPVMCPSPPPRRGVKRFAARCERPAVRHGGTYGVDALPRAGCAGRAGNAEPHGEEHAR